MGRSCSSYILVWVLTAVASQNFQKKCRCHEKTALAAAGSTNNILGDGRRRASFFFGNSSRNILGDRRRRASFILGGSSRNILGDRRRKASFILGESSRNYILGRSSWPGRQHELHQDSGTTTVQ